MSGYGDLVPAYEILKAQAKEAKESQYVHMNSQELLDFYMELRYWSLHHTTTDISNEILRRMDSK